MKPFVLEFLGRVRRLHKRITMEALEEAREGPKKDANDRTLDALMAINNNLAKLVDLLAFYVGVLAYVANALLTVLSSIIILLMIIAI